MEDGDAAAIARAQAGDRDSFRCLVDRHGRSVFRLAYRMTGNEFDAEDVVQETFLRAYRQIASYQSRSSFSTWLYRIAANYALDLMRSKRRHQVRQIDPEPGQPGLFETLEHPEPTPDRAYFSRQIRDRLDSALADLTEQERAAFVMRHFEGLSIEEIGATLDLAESATKNSIFRAVRKLRNALQPLVTSV
ncbi:MAG: RNA polymerase sigma factor [Acidobacteria bacterium]|nr:RNA polymerase sigma factor [Acidobacteriota bacterium]